MSLNRLHSPKSVVVPDFFIAGAPRCGTTSLYEALSRHPNLDLGALKEPNYFARDFPGHRVVTSEKAYERNFGAPQASILRGDSSPLYLASDCAVAEIHSRRPDSKFIVLVRRPDEMFQSLHNDFVQWLDEDVRDPVEAWNLQETRVRGHRIPKHCKTPILLQYRRTCSLGWQVRRLLQTVPRQQCLIALYDDLCEDPAGLLTKITEFLGVPNAPAQVFPQENRFAKFKTGLLAQSLQRSVSRPAIRHRLADLKTIVRNQKIRPLRWLMERARTRERKPPLPPAFLRQLRAAFQSDILLLEQLLNRDLSAWRTHDRPGVTRRADVRH